ncbi:MAG: arginine transport system substrate-binding protein [Psychromonas sp.]|jgi:arginine transport system substrate-binding protein|uniref:transporter substrate-binding domain-containing protein n=1 Tax=Psychromonas sp. TaxID=1884585 RepID=UPI0039E55629
MLMPRLLLSLFLLFSPFAILTTSAASLDNIKVRFATDTNYYPFEYLDEHKQIQGFDIDMAKAICKAVNLTCSFHHQRFESLLLSLSFARFDAVISALDITSERLEKVDFSNSYYVNMPVFISKKSELESFSTDGKFIGVRSKSSNQEYLIKYEKENSFIISYVTYSEVLADLRAGKIDAAFVDQAVAAEFLKQQDNHDNFVAQKISDDQAQLFSQGYGIAIQKGNLILQKRLNLGLKIITENGTYQKIYKRYF